MFNDQVLEHITYEFQLCHVRRTLTTAMGFHLVLLHVMTHLHQTSARIKTPKAVNATMGPCTKMEFAFNQVNVRVVWMIKEIQCQLEQHGTHWIVLTSAPAQMLVQRVKATLVT